MALTPCLSCGRLTSGSRCAACRPPQPTTAQRGYGGEHAALRAALRPAVERGEGYCTEPVCLEGDRWIPPGTPWDLAHTPDRSGYRGPAHQRCNRSEGARRGNRQRAGRWVTSRRW